MKQATRRKITVLMLVPALLLALSACQSVKRELGVGRHSPDEFTVVKRAPLSLPPDYDLRPPSPDNLPPASETAAQARATLMTAQPQPATAGTSEGALLEKMGVASGQNADIRSVINRENGFIALESKTVADKLIFWSDRENTPENMPASVVDPKAEAERLKQNQEAGKPVNEGDVPVIEKKKGTFDKLF